jgi:phosphoribosylaminoimidazole-succinocarboxamide synthase
MGSVKDLEIAKKPTRDVMGIGRFRFSDRYSVFDWGEMPDHIEGKGEALCLMGAYCFEKLEAAGVRTHYRGLVDENGSLLTFEELRAPTNIMEINLVNVYKPETRTARGKLEYDYGVFTPNLKNYLIPLEIIYRNGLPEGSSVFKRLEQEKVTIKDLGLDHYPKPGEHFAKPLFDVSTKLEETDRYVTWAEAEEMAGLTSQETAAIKMILSKVNATIGEVASHAGLNNEDGKIELAFDDKRGLMVADVVGTLDECRFTYDGMHVSKEIARQFYKRTDWYRDVEEAKKTAETRGVKEWRTVCKSQPPKLDVQLKAIIGEMYMAAANEMTERKMFAVSSLEDTIKKYKAYENNASLL